MKLWPLYPRPCGPSSLEFQSSVMGTGHRPVATRFGNSPSALENRGFAAVPYDRLICNDDSGAGFDGVVDLVSKLRINAEALSEFVGRNTAASARDGHPFTGR